MENALSLKEQEAAYTLGYEHYEKGEWRKAKRLFLTLVYANPSEGMYWKGLASTLQMQERYAEAVQAWALVALLDERAPLPHFHAAECLLALDEKKEAGKALQSARERLRKEDRELKEEIGKLQVWLSKKRV